jgi:RecJ-like exonuclease
MTLTVYRVFVARAVLVCPDCQEYLSVVRCPECDGCGVVGVPDGTQEPCYLCAGHGHVRWCPACGYQINA